jgi:hypothetical protein
MKGVIGDSNDNDEDPPNRLESSNSFNNESTLGGQN